MIIDFPTNNFYNGNNIKTFVHLCKYDTNINNNNTGLNIINELSKKTKTIFKIFAIDFKKIDT